MNSKIDSANSSPDRKDLNYWLIDGHEDIAWNAIEYGQDPTHSAYSSREIDRQKGVPEFNGTRTLGLPEWIAGKVGIIFSTLYIEPARFNRNPSTHMVYLTPEEASRFARDQITFYRGLTQKESRFNLLTTLEDVEKLTSSWDDLHQQGSKPIGLVILMEGADPVIKPEDVQEWAGLGVRIIGLAWSGTRYAGGTHEPGPLSDLGRDLLKEMAKNHLVLDLSHSAEAAFLEAVDTYQGTVIASHSNPRAFFNTDRSLSDEMILKLVKRDGVMGIVPYNHFLSDDWKRGNPRLSITRVVEAIDYVVQLVGNAHHVAIGTDFDGGFGVESIPAEMDTIADVIKLAGTLERKGYQSRDIQAILHGNWLRMLRNGMSM